MSDTVFSFNKFHLGDCLQSLHLIRALAKQSRSRAFVFFTNGCNLPQLREVVEDLPNILLEPFESPLWQEHERDAVDMWKNAKGYWEASRNRWQWSQFMLCHHAWTANRMGLHSPFTFREHLLLDYPVLENPTVESEYFALVVNSEPHSGQLSAMAEHGSGYLNGFIKELLNAGHRIAYTQQIDDDTDLNSNAWCVARGLLTISDIGSLSRRCRHILGVATGPLWPCVNTWNNHHHEGRRFVAMLNNGEDLHLPHWQQVGDIGALHDIARKEGWVDA